MEQVQDIAGRRGFTPNELAKVLRVSPDKVRAWIARGELKAINTAAYACTRPRFIVLPEYLAEFQRQRQAGPAPDRKNRQRQRPWTDPNEYFPDSR